MLLGCLANATFVVALMFDYAKWLAVRGGQLFVIVRSILMAKHCAY